MTTRSTLELRDLQIETQIGSYGPGEHAPSNHLLDLTLWIDSSFMLIETDGMTKVFDYDPLVAEMERLARDGPYETQERLLTRMLKACAAFTQIEAVEVSLRKLPIRPHSGSLGVRLYLDGTSLADLRSVPG
jgi:dihydroneopterin aldolase